MVAVLLLSLAFQNAPPVDSSGAVRAARAAQTDFERTRRRELPLGWGGTGGACDERIGRYCYWYNEQEPDPPPEPKSIARARRALLERLDQLAESLPGDGWIAGQRVRYLVEQGEPDSALAVARGCLAEAWWCAALGGFVLHSVQRYGEADSAYRFALATMPERIRCEWNDFESLLESNLVRAYARLSCPERDSANAVILWLARPRFAAIGHDLRTELLARQTYLATLERAETPWNLPVRDDLRELVLRYGWSTAWSQRPAPFGSSDPPTVVGHEPHPAYPFLPKTSTGLDAWAEWLTRERPRARFVPAWTPRIVRVRDVMVSRFERGDSLVLVSAFAVREDTLFQGDSVVARLALSSGPDSTPRVVEAGARDGRGWLVSRAEAAARLASLEITDQRTGVVALHRAWLGDSARGPRLSDLLLFEPQPILPESPDVAAPVALSSARIETGSAVGVYWELYDLPAGADSAGISVAVEEIGPGLLTRVGRAVGIGRAPPPIRLGWRTGELEAYAIELDLRLLGPGRYRIRVQAEIPGQGPIEASREIELSPRR